MPESFCKPLCRRTEPLSIFPKGKENSVEKYLINPNQKLNTICRDIYGTFSEHLGRCIYEGVFVGKDSPIPNHEGMRDDVVSALKDMGIPVLR